MLDQERALELARAVLSQLRPEPWLEPPGQKIRFRALFLLTSRQAANRTAPGETKLSSEEMRTLLRLAFEGALDEGLLKEPARMSRK